MDPPNYLQNSKVSYDFSWHLAWLLMDLVGCGGTYWTEEVLCNCASFDVAAPRLQVSKDQSSLRWVDVRKNTPHFENTTLISSQFSSDTCEVFRLVLPYNTDFT